MSKSIVKTLAIVVCLLVACASMVVRADGTDDAAALDQVRKRFIDHVKGDVSAAKEFAASCRADGIWSDVDYVSKERGWWPAARGEGRKAGHLNRLCEIGAGWRAGAGDEVLSAAHRALGWWLAKDPRNDNWWWNEIGVPQAIGTAGVLLADDLSKEEIAGISRILRRADASKCRTGQNHVWLARILLMRAMIEKDPALARNAVDQIASEIFLSDKEGIRPDWCFHQHGRQPQFGNYGLAYASTMTQLSAMFAGTSFAFAPEKEALLRALLEHGFRWICWNGMMDVSAMGRQIRSGAQRTKADSVRETLAMYARAHPDFPREEPIGFRFFGNSAYAIYRTKDWMASVRMASRTVRGVETNINAENVLGACLADGALLVYVTGSEYDDVFPLWGAWRHIPGITTYEDKTPGRTTRNDSDDVRGFETNGATVVEMELRREGLYVRKKWRFTPQAICCEGSGIISADPREVVTTVEQAIAAPDAEILPHDGRFFRARNGAVGYVVDAPAAAIRASVEEREGDYRSFNRRLPAHVVKGRVFSVVISHGNHPDDAAYRYWVLPSTTREKLLAFQPEACGIARP